MKIERRFATHSLRKAQPLVESEGVANGGYLKMAKDFVFGKTAPELRLQQIVENQKKMHKTVLSRGQILEQQSETLFNNANLQYILSLWVG